MVLFHFYFFYLSFFLRYNSNQCSHSKTHFSDISTTLEHVFSKRLFITTPLRNCFCFMDFLTFSSVIFGLQNLYYFMEMFCNFVPLFLFSKIFGAESKVFPDDNLSDKFLILEKNSMRLLPYSVLNVTVP